MKKLILFFITFALIFSCNKIDDTEKKEEEKTDERPMVFSGPEVMFI